MAEFAPRVTKFTNCLLARGSALVEADLWVDAHTGKILESQSAFYGQHLVLDQVIDLGGKIISPGFIDVQINGSHGFDFSVPSPDYEAELRATNQMLARSGVTSYLPTVISQRPKVYQSVLPHLGPSGQCRSSAEGSESLGVHVEGPFFSPDRNGIHSKEVLLQAESFQDIEGSYGPQNLKNVAMITAAPEVGKMMSLIPEFTSRGIIFSIGHSDAKYDEARAAVDAGATMVTHMFNAMRPFGHRDPGIFGLLGQATNTPPMSPATSKPPSPRSSQSSSPVRGPRPRRSAASSPRSRLSICSNASDLSDAPAQTLAKPFFGLISDGIHLHPSAIALAHSAHPSGTILVTDALHFAGLEDGVYDWTNGEMVVKTGSVIKSAKTGRLAGSAVTLIDCVNNFRRWTGCGAAEALACVTENVVEMLGTGGKDVGRGKGRLEGGCDADLCVLEDDGQDMRVVQVWKFGVKIHET